jgi:DNA polymerase III gamma/tau subunit
VIILILPRARAVPATLLSRCQVVRFGPRADAGAAAARAQALEILAEVKAQGVDALFRRTDRLEREKAEALVDAYWLYCRDLLLAKSGASSGLLIDAARAAELAREAEGWTVDQIVAAVDVCRQARDALLRNVAPRLTIEIVLSRLALRAA